MKFTLKKNTLNSQKNKEKEKEQKIKKYFL